MTQTSTRTWKDPLTELMLVMEAKDERIDELERAVQEWSDENSRLLDVILDLQATKDRLETQLHLAETERDHAWVDLDNCRAEASW